jgi:fatty-acid peroxygenase
VFYNNEDFDRHGAAPARLLKILFGKGVVQGIDGELHRWRKQMFRALMMHSSSQRLADISAEHWRVAIKYWESECQFVVFGSVQELLCRAVCEWAGVPLPRAEFAEQVRDSASMIESGGRAGVQYWRGRAARTRAEDWVGDVIERVRQVGSAEVDGTAVQVIALYRDQNGALLKTRVAAVALLNVLRPTVVVAHASFSQGRTVLLDLYGANH